MTAANIIPTAPTDGILYSSSVPLTSTEADLYGGTGANAPNGPIATVYGQAIVAVIRLTVSGYIVASNTYVVMQLDLGDGVWVDMNWLVWTGKQGDATFVFSNGVAGANSVQQSRDSGAFPTPQASGSNQLGLGGRMRFVGRTVATGGSSNVAGTPTVVTATINYRLVPLR